ncbi:MAG: ParB N-terminal domain-containing protein [Afipia sp.]|nr:ParB N-terminal domain-containing protein [Afipia sp.]
MPISDIQQLPPTKLRPNPSNVRKHSKKQITELANHIEKTGFLVPVIADEQYVILTGHARVLAAKQLDLPTIPAIIASHLSEAQRRAFILFDNKISSKSEFDQAALAVELQALAPLLAEEGLSLEFTGFEAAELDAIFANQIDTELEPADIIPEVETRAVSRVGDLWELGNHRLLCGDSRNAEHVKTLMDSTRAFMVFTDPPYNVRISSVQGRGRRKHREFAVASGEMSRAEFTEFLARWMLVVARYTEDGAIVFCCMDWKHLAECLAAGEQAFTELKNIIAWVKSNAGQGSFYRSQHELILVFKNGTARHQNNIELGKHGRSRSNVWQYAGVNSFRKDRFAELTVHPTVKPVALVADAIRDCSRRGDIVLDPFMGSGTTILAAEKVGRKAYGIEIDPYYVDVAIRRWQDFTKRDAILESTGQTFEEVAAKRSRPRRYVRAS